MAQPKQYERFADFFGMVPTSAFPAAQVETEFDRVKESLDETQAALADLRRDDGELANETVGLDQLKPEVTSNVNASVAAAAASASSASGSAAAADASAVAAAASVASSVKQSDIGVTVQGYIAGLASITSYGFNLADSVDAAAARSVLELGTAATQASSAFATAAQGATADTAVQPGDLGTAAYEDTTAFATAAQGATADTAVQPSASLTAIRALTPAADRLPYFTNGTTAALATFTAAGRALVDDADAAAQRTTLGLTIGTNVQAYDALLASIAGLTVAAGGFIRTSAADTAVAQAIVGTVSQSGGTPTGAIVERGSNANGDYVKYADGTMICWFTLATTGNVDVATGALFWQSAGTTWTFPGGAFAAAPTVTISGSRNDCACGGSMTGVSTSAATVRAWASVSTAAAIALRCVAAGRWF
ncbi:hypothetical protein GGQ64_005351 [Rhizobium azooxidifex]|uniref:Uncharacterized protein n=1 Tax=Mycoplana azooxidifex TaxID=1636188 RepID=A0A7W6GNL6_9HYPH|nr:hypothetical protein [Mycoplana azooxidifex]MBB3980104.1 hypothetical protein [Mycoplana azooxidifex]